MKNLTKADIERRDGYAEKLRELRGKIEDQFRLLNEEILAPLNAAIATYNEELGEARGFLEDLASEMSSYYDDRSDKWRDGDAGSAYAEWKSAYENFEAEDLEEIVFEDTTAENNTPEDIEALPVAPE